MIKTLVEKKRLSIDDLIEVYEDLYDFIIEEQYIEVGE